MGNKYLHYLIKIIDPIDCEVFNFNRIFKKNKSIYLQLFFLKTKKIKKIN